MTSDTVLTRFTAFVADALGHDGYTVPFITPFMAINTRRAHGDVRRRISLHVHAGKGGEHIGFVADFARNRSRWNVG